MKSRVIYCLYLEPVTESEVIKLVSSLKSSSPGYDNLSSSILKLCLQFIKTPLTYLCNLSLQEGIFPQELKTANVLPLFKSGDEFMFNNYRPVSMLCSLSKVFEKIMYTRLLSYLNDHKILFSYQFGFRKSHSTYMALMVLMDKLNKALDDGNMVIGVFLDFSKAFDTVDHDILLFKLSHYGIRDNALLWFKSYLSNRNQFVTYDGVRSSLKTIKCGVPQGSILGPLLFLIYINDLCNVCGNSLPILFADDSNIFTVGKTLDDIEKLINKELADISMWLNANRLSLNIKKTQYMVFSRKKRTDKKIYIKINNHSISETKSSKFLGVYIDNCLNWKKHLSYTASKLARGIGILLKCRKYLNNNSMVLLYYSFIYPFLIYCNQVWGNTYKTNLNKLQVLQNRAVRIITGSSPRSNVNAMYDKAGLMKVNEINNFLTGMFTYRYHHKQLPYLFDDFFTYNYEIHEYETRNAYGIHIPQCRTSLSQFGIRYRGAIVWNRIFKAKINQNTSELSFKTMLKKCILNGIINTA